jgi:hypothetical protein
LHPGNVSQVHFAQGSPHKGQSSHGYPYVPIGRSKHQRCRGPVSRERNLPVLIRDLNSLCGATGETKGTDPAPKAILAPTKGKSPGVILLHV